MKYSTWGSATIAAIVILLALPCLLLVSPQTADATTYKYVDDKGVTLLVDDINKIPVQFRSKALKLKEKTEQDGYAPSFNEVKDGKKAKPGTWYKYTDMGWMDKVKLIAEGGTADLDGVIKDMAIWIGAAALIVIVSIVLVFKALKGGFPRSMVLTLIMLIVGIGLFTMYIKTVKDRKDFVMDKIKNIQGVQQQRMDKMNAALRD